MYLDDVDHDQCDTLQQSLWTDDYSAIQLNTTEYCRHESAMMLSGWIEDPFLAKELGAGSRLTFAVPLKCGLWSMLERFTTHLL